MSTYSYKIKMVDGRCLYHHGIEGQKWGVENGPPYPLDPEDHSAAEKRAMAREERRAEKRKKKNQKYIDIANKRLNKRQDYIDEKYNIDNLSSKLGTMGNIETSANQNAMSQKVRDLNNAIKSNEDRMIALGKKTRNMRVADLSIGSLATAGTSAAAAAALAAGSVAAAPLLALPVAAIATTAYIYKLTTR